MAYDCVTCGHLDTDYHDGRDDTPCAYDCIPLGECQHAATPAQKGEDGLCYWRLENGHTDGWGLPDPRHRKRTEDDLPSSKPLPGQIGFDGTVVGTESGSVSV